MPHDVTRETAVRILLRVERGGAFAQPLLDAAFKRRISPESRPFLTELVLGSLRMLAALDFAVEWATGRPKGRLDPTLLAVLRTGAYQVLYMSVPRYAAVSETVDVARALCGEGAAALANAALRRIAGGPVPFPRFHEDPAAHMTVTLSHPPYLVEAFRKAFGDEEARALCEANNLPPPVTVRAFSPRIGPDELRARLEAEGARPRPGRFFPGVFDIEGAPESYPSFRKGLFLVCDEASVVPVLLLSVSPGQTVFDMCAGPGGKSVHLAELVGEGGQVVAVEPNPRRARRVEEAGRRFGLANLAVVIGTAQVVAAQQTGRGDAVLVDAPCANTGVLRRRVEARWRVSPEEVARLAALQQEILDASAQVVKPGGRLVYSVCSLLPEETSGVVDAFLRRHPQFVPAGGPAELERFRTGEGRYLTLPHRDGIDGMFCAVFRRVS